MGCIPFHSACDVHGALSCYNLPEPTVTFSYQNVPPKFKTILLKHRLFATKRSDLLQVAGAGVSFQSVLQGS